MNNISKETIDAAGELRKTGMTWADIAEELYKQGHTYINNTRRGKDKIHNQGLHAAVTSDPKWAFLKTKRMISDNVKGFVVAAMVKHGVSSELMEAVINELNF